MERSRYLGVYTNKYKPTCKEFPYRVSVKRYSNNVATYTDIGFFKTEETAANIYNIYALDTFGKGAVINDIPLSEETREEMQLYFDNTYGSNEILFHAMQILEKYTTEIQVNKPA